MYCSARASYVEITYSKEALILQTNSKLLVDHIPRTDPNFRHELTSGTARRSTQSRRIEFYMRVIRSRLAKQAKRIKRKIADDGPSQGISFCFCANRKSQRVICATDFAEVNVSELHADI